MKFGKMTVALAAGTLAVAPIAAQATVSERSAPLSEASENGAGSGAIIGLAALVALAIAIAAGGDEDPVSN